LEKQLAPAPSNVQLVAADVTDRTAVDSVVRGADAVLSALGTHQMNEATTVYSVGAANILAAMREADVRRFIAISATPVGAPRDLAERLIYPILYRFFGAAYEDMKRMEAIVAASDCDWTIFRPPTAERSSRNREIPHRNRCAAHRRLADYTSRPCRSDARCGQRPRPHPASCQHCELEAVGSNAARTERISASVGTAPN
jgi:nucleoside-diphosphate-sugar epimerase